jgi:hypothetical protein
VNAGVAAPECIFGPCADVPDAYKTVEMQKTVRSGRGAPAPPGGCPLAVNCAAVRELGGSHNVAAGVLQPQDCDTPHAWAIEHLSTIVLFLILVTVLAVLTFYRLPRRNGRARPDRPSIAPPIG